MLNDPKNLFKHVRNIMGTRNYNQGNYLIYNNTKIYDPQLQTNIFAKTWESEPRNDLEIQEHITYINNWFENNIMDIIPHTKTDLNRLNKATPALAPIRLINTINFMNKIKSQGTGPSGITSNIIKHAPRKTALHVT